LEDLGVLVVIQGADPPFQLAAVGGDQDRGGLALDSEPVPGGETPVPQHPERDAVLGDERLSLAVAVLGADADDVDFSSMIPSELLEAGSFPGAVRSMWSPEPVEGRAVGQPESPEVHV
jgi:hypothetical protein